MRFVDVAVPLPLHSTFTYRVPAELEESVAAGKRVEVPFGNQVLVAYVVGAEAPASDRGPRDLLAVLDDEPSLSGELLELCRWASDYYLCGLGEMLKAALPAALAEREEAEYRVSEKGVMRLAALPPGDERDLLERLLRLGKASARRLREESGRPLHQLLRHLEEAGWIRPHGQFGREKRRTVRGIVAKDVPATEAGLLLGRSAAQRVVWDYLSAEGRPLLVEEVTRACSCSSAVLAALAKKGLVSFFEQDREYSLTEFKLPRSPAPAIVPTPEQEAAIAALSAAVTLDAFAPFLLHGVTGSGKTEVYLRALAAATAAGKGGLFLVPEIGLTPVFARALERQFGARVAILHSSLSAAERRQEWEDIRAGRKDIVVGPRSAVFAPVGRLGLVIVDEEHDSSYKQDESPRYHGRDLAVVRARLAGAVVVLGSATPSLESFHNASLGRYTLLQLGHRVPGSSLPRVEVVDLRREPPESADPRDKGRPLLSSRLRQELQAALAASQQAILLINRRGYSEYLLCRECDNDFRCRNCSVTLTYHKRRAALVCHYCDYREETPRRCPRCGGEILHPVGAGTERVAERCHELFPEARVGILDRDQARKRGAAAQVLRDFESRRLDILVGTQMVAKGHHFPGVVLTGIVSADGLLGFPDFRAAEKTFQLMTQVAGRSGRGEAAGTVILQTLFPNHYAVQFALAQDYAGFCAAEMRFRRAFRYPPLTGMAVVLVRGENEAQVRETSEDLARALGSHPDAGYLRILGPAAAPLSRLQGKYRYQVLLRGADRRQLQRLLRDVVVPYNPGAGLAVVTDVDPVNIL